MTDQEKDLNQQGRQQWDAKAEFWDNLHGDEGNRFHRELISPAVERLLAIKPGEQILDIACGSGVMARRMAALGAEVTAVDFSPALIARAQARKQVRGNPVVYKVADATDEEALVQLGAGQFAAVTCTMALMDMPSDRPALPGGYPPAQTRWTLCLRHLTPGLQLQPPHFPGRTGRDGRQANRTTDYMKVEAYLDIPPRLAVGARDEP